MPLYETWDLILLPRYIHAYCVIWTEMESCHLGVLTVTLKRRDDEPFIALWPPLEITQEPQNPALSLKFRVFVLQCVRLRPYSCSQQSRRPDLM
jgi:hypothetical protein